MFGITDTAKWKTKRKMSRKLDLLGGYPKRTGERWWEPHLAGMKREREQRRMNALYLPLFQKSLLKVLIHAKVQLTSNTAAEYFHISQEKVKLPIK